MITFASRLARALGLCNNLGVPLAAGVAALGVAIIVTQGFLWQRMGVELTVELRELVGERHFAEIEADLDRPFVGSDDTARISNSLLRAIEARMEPLAEEYRQDALIEVLKGVIRRSIPVAAPFVILLLLLQVFARAYFLVLPARRAETSGSAALGALQALPRLAATWVGVFLCSCGWAPPAVFVLGFTFPQILILALPSILPIIALFPRFLLAPAIAVREETGWLESLRLSYARTEGRWWLVTSSMLGVGAVLWIATTLSTQFLGLLVQGVTQFSSLGYVLYWLTPFLGLVAMAYRSAFTVQLSEELAHPEGGAVH